jgi:tetratricopeptide (TPR) repeat protein
MIWYELGNALRDAGEPADESIAAFTQSLALNPDFASGWDGLGRSLGDRGRFAEALSAFERAVALDASLALGWYGCGSALVQLRRPDEAQEAFDRAIALFPRYTLAWMGKGDAYSLRPTVEAIALVQQAFAQESAEVLPHLEQALQAKHPTEALAAFDRALELDPRLPGAASRCLVWQRQSLA